MQVPQFDLKVRNKGARWSIHTHFNTYGGQDILLYRGYLVGHIQNVQVNELQTVVPLCWKMEEGKIIDCQSSHGDWYWAMMLLYRVGTRLLTVPRIMFVQ